LVCSLGGRRLFKIHSKTHDGNSFSSSVPLRSVIFFLHGPLCEPSVIIEGGETVENANGGYTAESFSPLLSTSPLETAILLPDVTSPLDEEWDTNLCFFLANQWTNSPLRVSRARLIWKKQRNHSVIKLITLRI